MKKYSLNTERGKHFILEVKTQILFGPFETKNKARDQMGHMNKGGAFDGYTPSFMLNGESND